MTKQALFCQESRNRGKDVMPFGDFNNDGHVDGSDYALFKIATGDNDSGDSSGGSGGGGGCGCLTMIVVILIVYGILKLFGG